MTSPEDRENAAKYLHPTATHFAQRDWNYTRLTKIKHIRYEDDWKGYHTLGKRIKRAFEPKYLFGRGPLSKMFRSFDKDKPWHYRLRSAVYAPLAWIRVQLRTDNHMPDGELDGGSVITHWEETGEYIQVVQPSVGELVAEFLLADPENPHAVKIADEISRILDGYSARAKAGKVDGRKRESQEDQAQQED